MEGGTLLLCNHPARFGDHRYCGIAELLIVYPHPAKIDSHRDCVNEYITTLVCHVILPDHVYG